MLGKCSSQSSIHSPSTYSLCKTSELLLLLWYSNFSGSKSCVFLVLEEPWAKAINTAQVISHCQSLLPPSYRLQFLSAFAHFLCILVQNPHTYTSLMCSELRLPTAGRSLIWARPQLLNSLLGVLLIVRNDVFIHCYTVFAVVIITQAYTYVRTHLIAHSQGVYRINKQ